MKKIFLFFPVLFAGTAAQAQAPTWATDVVPILYNKCASCHRSGGIAPFALMTYADATAPTIGARMKASTQSGHMPPWPPDPTYHRLANERLLSGDEKAKIAAWVDGGMAQGNIAAAPPQPTFPTTGDLPGTPSLTTQIPTYTSTAMGTDVYRCFVLPTGLTADKFITAFEAVPGNRGIVHHVLVYADTTGVSTQLDAADPGPGYTSFGGIGVNDAALLGGWVPGTPPMQYPAGFGVRLSKDAKLVVQIHYPAGSVYEVDSTKIRMFFASSATREVLIQPVLNHAVNISPSLVIPANTTRTFREHFVTSNYPNMSLLGIAPHMHLIGRSIKTYGVAPNGDTMKFISIPDWDFHWQGFYMMRNLVKVPTGTHLWSEAFYDNTSANPHNPSNPPQTVTAGEATTDEMMLTYFIATYYLPGDENIMIDSTTPVTLGGIAGNFYSGQELLEPYPNPAANTLYVKCHLQRAETMRFELVGVDGRVQRLHNSGVAVPAGYSVREYDLSAVPIGMYLLRMYTEGGVKTQKVTVIR